MEDTKTGAANIQRLSNELLILIFEFLLKMQTSSPAHSIFDLVRMPWVLTHVCSRWRTVVTTSAELWTFAFFRWSDRSKPNLLRLFLERSQTRSIHIKFHRHCNEESLRILTSHSSRWKSLTMDVERIRTDLFEPIRGQVPFLEELNLTLSESSMTPLALNGFSEAPMLTRVTLRCPLDSNIVLPWRQLHRFEGFIDAMTPQFLGEAPNLESYHLIRRHQSNSLLLDPISCPTVLRHQHLRQVKVKFIEDLKHLELPELRSLDILVPSYTTLYQLDRLVSRSNCRLTKFSLGHVRNVDPLDFIRFFRSSPHLNELSLSLNTIDQAKIDQIFSALSYSCHHSHSRPPLLPHLDTLTLALYTTMDEDKSPTSCPLQSPSKFDYQMLVSLLESRRCTDVGNGFSHISSCTLQLFDKIDQEFWDRLLMLRRTGLELRILGISGTHG